MCVRERESKREVRADDFEAVGQRRRRRASNSLVAQIEAAAAAVAVLAPGKCAAKRPSAKYTRSRAFGRSETGPRNRREGGLSLSV